MTTADIKRMLQTSIQRAIQTSSPSDGTYPKSQLNFMGQTAEVRSLNPYGFYSASPINSEWTIFSVRGNSDDKWGIGNVFKGRYDKVANISGLKEGESLMLNVKTGSYILLKEDGTIEIDSQKEINVTSKAKVTVVAPDLEITGDVKITGALEVIGDVDTTGTLKNNTVNVGSSHIHSGVTTGAGVSGPPT